jgi:hypothetical protein
LSSEGGPIIFGCVFNGQSEALPVRIKDAASTLLRITWEDVSMISVEDGLLTIRFRTQNPLRVIVETQDIPNLLGLIRTQ